MNLSKTISQANFILQIEYIMHSTTRQKQIDDTVHLIHSLLSKFQERHAWNCQCSCQLLHVIMWQCSVQPLLHSFSQESTVNRVLDEQTISVLVGRECAEMCTIAQCILCISYSLDLKQLVMDGISTEAFVWFAQLECASCLASVSCKNV